MDRVKVGVIGSGFQADVHCASIQIMPEAAEGVAIASPSAAHARAPADRYGITRSFLDYRKAAKGARHRNGHHHAPQRSPCPRHP
jgi:predicted dehydrogenase